jgi:hypothetical protein
MSKEDRPKNTRKGGKLIEHTFLLSLITMEGFEDLRPFWAFFNGKKRVLEVGQKSTDPLIYRPKKNWCCHIGDTKQTQDHNVHGTKLNGSRSGQQYAQNNQVMIEASNALLGDHVEMPPSAVVLVEYCHFSLPNVQVHPRRAADGIQTGGLSASDATSCSFSFGVGNCVASGSGKIIGGTSLCNFDLGVTRKFSNSLSRVLTHPVYRPVTTLTKGLKKLLRR